MVLMPVYDVYFLADYLPEPNACCVTNSKVPSSMDKKIRIISNIGYASFLLGLRHFHGEICARDRRLE